MPMRMMVVSFERMAAALPLGPDTDSLAETAPAYRNMCAAMRRVVRVYAIMTMNGSSRQTRIAGPVVPCLGNRL